MPHMTGTCHFDFFVLAPREGKVAKRQILWKGFRVGILISNSRYLTGLVLVVCHRSD